MKILVTGGAGFVGSHIVDLLINNEHEVIVVDSLISGKKENINKKAKFYPLDIRTKELEDVFASERPEIVYHLAAQSKVTPSMKDPNYDQSVNIGGTINILELMKKYEVKKIIYSSSAALYGDPIALPIKEEDHPLNPISPYGMSKWASERYIELYYRMYGIQYTIFRYANIYGPRQQATGEGGVIAIFIDRLRLNQSLTINGDGRHTRDYVFVKDVAKANLLAIDKGNQSIINISSGQAISLLELIKMLETITEKKIEIIHGKERKGDIIHSTLDPSISQELLAWEATTPLIEGLKLTLKESQ